MVNREIRSSKYHVVWIPKFRKAFLKGKIKDLVEESLIEKSCKLNVEIIKLQVMPDHVHLFISIPVTLSICYVIRNLKGYSSYYVRKNLNLYKYKFFWGKGYFCESVGQISESTIKKYIDNQWRHYKPNSSHG